LPSRSLSRARKTTPALERPTALRALVAERLEGDVLELAAVYAEDLDAGLDGVHACDGDEDVLTVGGPDGLRGMTAGVKGVDLKDLCGGDGREAECDRKEQRAHEATISFGERSVSEGG
jgi:hypothetical protein